MAGKRAGIQNGERSNLFFEAIRIIKEMRESTNGEYPKYAVWENVPGAFSSNKGWDFHAVLEAFCTVCDDSVSIPEPYDTKRTKLVWNKSGEIVGDNYSIAWRTLDAQYWGVPQRRKRIYLVADFTGQCAREILFKPESLRGDMQENNEARKGATADDVGGVNGSSGNGGQLAATLTATYGTKWNGNAGSFNGENFVLQNKGVNGSVGAAGVVSKGDGDCFIMPERHMALSVGGGQAGQGYPCTVYSFDSLSSNSMKSSNPFSGCRAVEVAKCIDTSSGDPSKNQGGVAVVQPVVALQANGIDRADTAGCNGKGWTEEVCYTLNTVDRHAVCYENHQHGGYREGCGTLRASGGDYGGGSENVVCYDARGNGDGETACTITGDHQNRIMDYTAVAVQEALAISGKQQSLATSENMANTLGANDWKEPQSVCYKDKPPRKYIIRRLLPVECARLQGFPDEWGKIPAITEMSDEDYDFWTECRKVKAMIDGKRFQPKTKEQTIKWYNKLHTDSAEYKAYGNGLALPCAAFVLRGIAKEGAKTLGSLFDGIGGFPLAGLLNGITPLFSSEVEPYPIAVTKARLN